MFIIKIQVLDPRHYLAILTVREALSLGLSPDMGKPWLTLTLRDRLAAAHIFSEISRRYGVNVKKNRILLRFSRILSGETLLLFSLLPQKRRILRPTHPGRWCVFEFSQAEDLFRSAELLCRRSPSCSTWLYRWFPSGWRLLLHTSLKSAPSLRCALGEYAQFSAGGTLAAAFTREHAVLLCEEAAQRLSRQSFPQD